MKILLAGLLVVYFSSLAHADIFGPCLKISIIGIADKVFSSPIIDGDLEKKIRDCPGLKKADTIRFLLGTGGVEGVLIGHSAGCIQWVRSVTLVNLMDLAEHRVCPAKNP